MEIFFTIMLYFAGFLTIVGGIILIASTLITCGYIIKDKTNEFNPYNPPSIKVYFTLSAYYTIASSATALYYALCNLGVKLSLLSILTLLALWVVCLVVQMLFILACSKVSSIFCKPVGIGIIVSKGVKLVMVIYTCMMILLLPILVTLDYLL